MSNQEIPSSIGNMRIRCTSGCYWITRPHPEAEAFFRIRRPFPDGCEAGEIRRVGAGFADG